jgi:gluconate 2-dehydrogenase gamma chain
MQSSNKAARVSRRQFIAVTAIGSAAAVLGCSPGKKTSWEFLSEVQAHALAVLCDQIIPADDFPSASQAGVLTYIDKQLVRHYRRHREAYRDGLARAGALSVARYGKPLAELQPGQQFEIAHVIEQQDHSFFELMRQHTLEGYYGTPRHGGNRDAVSWRMLGLPEPPPLGRAQYDLRKESAS